MRLLPFDLLLHSITALGSLMAANGTRKAEAQSLPLPLHAPTL